MKNLKKVLSLALAFAMVLGLCVTGMAAEDVTTAADWDSVTDKDAALLLNAFEIMEGSDEDGVLMFNPENDVTRAEAAAMISRALWGGKDTPELYANGNAGAYIDVVTGAWYMGYVNFMTVKAIMVGDGDGEFRPNGNVTGYELLKMALVAVGYDAEVEGLTGLGWDLRTMALATLRGYTDLTAGTTVTDWNAPLSRMNAAIIISNMIYRQMVGYDEGKAVVLTYDNDNNKDTAEVPYNFGTYTLGMLQAFGTLLANEYGSTVNDTIPTDADDYAGENAIVELNGTQYEVVLTSGIENLGQAVTFFFVDKVAEENLVSVAVVEPVEMTPSFNKAGDFTNEDDNVTYTVNVDTTVSDLNDTGIMSFVNGKWNVASNGTISYYDTDDNGKIDTVKAYDYDSIMEIKGVAETENYGTVYQLTDTEWKSTWDKADAPLRDNFIKADDCTFTAEKGDFVTYFETTNVFGDKVYNGYVLDVIEGKVSRINGTTFKVSIDGVEYVDNNDGEKKLGVGDEGTFYLYADGSIAHFEGVSTYVAPTYAMIWNAGAIVVDKAGVTSGSVSLEVSATLEDNTTANYIVEKIVDIDTKGTTDTKDDVEWNFNISAANTEDELETVSGTDKNKNPSTLELLSDTGILAGVSDDTANVLVQYTINEKTGNMIIHLTNGATVGYDATIDSGKKIESGNEKVDTLYLLEKGVTFVKGKTSAGAETWTAYTGTTVPSITLKAAANVVLGDRYTEGDDLGIKYMVIEESEGTTVTGFYYIVSNSDNLGNGNYETVIYNGATNEVETVAHKGGAVDAGEMYGEFSSEGFAGEIAYTEKGNIVVVSGKDIVIESFEDGDEHVYTTDNDTTYYLIDGKDTTEIELTDLSVQADVSDSKPATWQTLIVGTAGKASKVIVYVDEQDK